MESFIPTGDENDYYNQGVNIIIPHQEREIPLYQQPLGRVTLTKVNDMRGINEVEQRPVDQTDILAGSQHIVNVNRHFFNVLVDRAEPFKDLIVQRDRVESVIPFNEEVFQLKWRDVSNAMIQYHVLAFDFMTIELMMVKKTPQVRQCFFCSGEIFDNCLMYKVVNRDIDDTFWIVFLKLMKFIPAIIRKDLNKEIYDICQLERELDEIKDETYKGINSSRGDMNIKGRYNISTDLYDIQINNVNLNRYYIEGYKCKRDDQTITPFYFQVVKGNVRNGEGIVTGYEYFVITNLYNQRDEEKYLKTMYKQDLDTMSLEKMQSTEIGNIQYQETEPVMIDFEAKTQYYIEHMESQDIPTMEKILGKLKELKKVPVLERKVSVETKKRIYTKDAKGKTHWKKNPNLGTQTADRQLVFSTLGKNKTVEGTPYMNLHFVVTIPYTATDGEWVDQEQQKYLLTKSELLTLVYELSLVNGEHLLQLPKMETNEKGLIDFTPNENMPGLETVEEMQVRQQQEQEALLQQQLLYEQQVQQMQQMQQMQQQMYTMNGVEGQQYGYPAMEMEQQYYPMEQVPEGEQGEQQYYTGQPEQMMYPQGEQQQQEYQYQEQQEQIPIQQEYQEQQSFLHPETGLELQGSEEPFNTGNINP